MDPRILSSTRIRNLQRDSVEESGKYSGGCLSRSKEQMNSKINSRKNCYGPLPRARSSQSKSNKNAKMDRSREKALQKRRRSELSPEPMTPRSRKFKKSKIQDKILTQTFDEGDVCRKSEPGSSNIELSVHDIYMGPTVYPMYLGTTRRRAMTLMNPQLFPC